MDEVWSARRDALPASRARGEDLAVALLGDVVVPVSNYPAFVVAVADASETQNRTSPCVGLAGDGNLHQAPWS